MNRSPTPDDLPRGERQAARAVHAAFWILLWRAPSAREAQECARSLAAGQPLEDLVQRLLASAEFRVLYTAVRGGADTGRPLQAVTAGLEALGSHVEFVDALYPLLLGREADEGGRGFYVGHLEAGEARLSVLTTLLVSEEFANRDRALCPQAGYVPRDVQLCELANPAKWHNPEWRAILQSLVVVPDDEGSMHRKAYEFVQLLFGLTRLGYLREDVSVLSVGAGHEPVLYWLANRVRRVVATDLYGGAWQVQGAMEGDRTVLVDPRQFAPFAYREEALRFLPMDGRELAFRDGAFDVVYSLSSVEHFGGLEGAQAAVADMARVLRPGGLLALATEYCVAGPPHHEAFQPDQVHRLLRHPQLQLVQAVDERVWDRYDTRPVDLRVNPYQTPHMLVTDRGSVFTSVMAFLRKQA